MTKQELIDKHIYTVANHTGELAFNEAIEETKGYKLYNFYKEEWNNDQKEIVQYLIVSSYMASELIRHGYIVIETPDLYFYGRESYPLYINNTKEFSEFTTNK